MTSTALAPTRESIGALERAQQEVAVTRWLSTARDNLSEAVAATGPAGAAAFKAQASSIEELSRQFGLSKEIQLDAAEMTRRCEYELGKAIRRGQADGTIRRVGDDCRTDLVVRNNFVEKASPSDFATKQELSGNKAGIYDLVDGITDEEFVEALTEARTEGNVSRASVVRKVRDIAAGPETRKQRADLIAELAADGLTSKGMASQVGVSDQSVRTIARDYGIDIPADRVTARRRALDSTRILSGVTESLSVAAESLRLVDPAALDRDQAKEMVDSLAASLTAIRKALEPIKESIQ